MTPENARHQLYLVSYSLEELAKISQDGAAPVKLDSTLDLLSEIMLDAIAVIHPYIPETTIPPLGSVR